MQRATDAANDEDGAHLAAWIGQHVGGTVTRVERMPRWRPAWDVDVDLDGRVLPLHARGEREPRIAMPNRIADEVAVHDLLEEHGLPVPHAYGLCDEPYALVMDRLSGLVDLAGASDAEREDVLEEYLELLARIYAIPLDAAAAAGFAIPSDSATTELAFLRRMEELYDRDTEGHPADPVEVFLRRWLRDHAPEGRRESARFITYDSFQFMFEHGHITGLLDFEHAHVGDPMMDLAALRIRDTLKSLGDLPALTARYEEVTGVVVDHDVVEYQTVLYNALSVVSVGPPLAHAVPGTDWISYLAWYVNGGRWAFESIRGPRATRPPSATWSTACAPPPRAIGTTTSSPDSGASRATSSGSTRSARSSMPTTSTTSPRCWATGRMPPTPMRSWSSSSRRRGPSTKSPSCGCSTRACNGCTSPWRRRRR
jgi:aminoglycoside phosphotransferase (APT) family kinase protein